MQDFRMETFLTVCSYLNFTKAAQELNLTQPAVSQHIHFLEREYGVKLFRQNGKKILLTEAGEVLRNAALTMKHDEIHLKNKLKKTEDKKKDYTFGATLTASEYVLPSGLAAFLAHNPESHVKMFVNNTRELLRKLDLGELDFAIIEGDFPRGEYDYLPYSLEKYVPVGNKEKAKALKGKTVQDILGETLVIREAGSGTREILEKYLEHRGIEIGDFTNLIELGNIGTIKEMVKRGTGISFLYQAAITGETELTPIALEGFPILHELMFIFRKNSIFKKDYEKIYKEFV